MRALVTGGAGFIGSHITDALVARGDEVTVLDNLTGGTRENLAGALAAGARLEVADIRDADAVRTIVGEAAPEVVFHLAAQPDVRRSIEDPALDAQVNVVGTINVLEAARTAGARRFVNTSTGGGIYGDVDVFPTPETVAPLPMAPYGQSKQTAELYCAWANRLYGFSTVSLRYGNVFGPRQNPHGDAGVIAIFCGKALAGEAPVIFGDGRQTRDYIHVDDVVAANLLVADREDVVGSFNIGTEVESTVLDLIDAVRDALPAGSAFDPEFRPARLGELDRSVLDASRARETFGFAAQVSLRDGIAATYAAAAAAAAAA